MIEIQNYIDGELAAPVSGNYLENIEPAKGEVYSKIPDSDKRDIENATAAALRAFPVWSKTPAKERSNILMRIAELIDQNSEMLAAAESRDNGKPIKLARSVDIPRARDNFHFFATGILHFASEAHEMEGVAINYTRRQPIGVAGCISPWNLPLYLFTWKIAPALAAGNCVVAKPSEVTPMTAYLLSKICIEAGLPAGVLNIVHGLGPKVGQAISEHPHIKAISFTGGTATGKRIAQTAAPMFKKLSLELGGKNPNIIFADCDFEEALKTTVRSSFANQGQICLCGSRIFIERAIYEKFRDAFVDRVSRLKVSYPEDPDAKLGAVVSKSHFEKILSYIDLAREEGGHVLTGGEPVQLGGDYEHGYYLRPTVIEGLAHSCRTNQEEIFGPVVTLTPFDSEEEVLAMANSVEYGLSATIWTENLRKAHRVAHKVEAGIVWVNCWLVRDLRTPFGGMKNSGVGREGGFEALRFFTEPKNVCIKL
ncbi:MAG TPA: 2-hydroxymuconic semialdehyde dehydrogenase [Flavobacteriales bacterium]|jgi:aminomuconate-semialdehyde/2-hydroxymuconate-6-semialdehyde dehydrogenase|nr:2-hydroxymuconic semialdehyde dehydrogenase [Flavobacteriales bacterium]